MSVKLQENYEETPLDVKGSACLRGSISERETFSSEHNVLFDASLEKSVCWKFDVRILPMIAVMYLFNALDKGNISNAKTDHIDKDLSIEGQQWNNMLSIFYIPFVLFAFPLSLVIKKYNAANVIPILMFIFGSISLLSATAFNYGSLMAARWFLGICESAFFSGIIYYLSTFYRRHELARRLSIFYAAANIANAFSGLLSFGVFQIKNSKLKGWQILFLIEGSLTVTFAVVAFLYLPRSPEKSHFLTGDEKECAKWRIEVDSSAKSEERISFTDAVKVFKHPIAIAWMVQEILIGVPLNSINNWFPQIVQSLGKGTVQTNLYTVAPNVWGAIALIILSFSSDYARIRSVFIMIGVSVTLIGFVVFGCVDTKSHLGAAYFSCFLMTTGSSVSSVLTSTWYNNNTPNENRRVVISAVGVPLANAAGLISTNIFRPKDAPKYLPALGITAGFGGAAILLVAGILCYMIFDNHRRNKRQGIKLTYKDVPTSELAEGPSNPNYRWMY
ncbi:KLTH0E03146p [Lachancea thermotolerans CBS 6340]|uniref:KLTH0E03146p n=1 Tax=Lachancea thermotolerans (strain ATCC 56472 / CBS 6340 / NRRL Y-8284) TaxID=559295 RepID=C5DHC4_LACTC|nr:KLTH0E03146p [Lachancea thermotolerans CBS 6340]CAR23185.1 KLTH0E03146p [Lachancea thermotolerans CBS 6340]